MSCACWKPETCAFASHSIRASHDRPRGRTATNFLETGLAERRGETGENKRVRLVLLRFHRVAFDDFAPLLRAKATAAFSNSTVTPRRRNGRATKKQVTVMNRRATASSARYSVERISRRTGVRRSTSPVRRVGFGTRVLSYPRFGFFTHLNTLLRPTLRLF